MNVIKNRGIFLGFLFVFIICLFVYRDIFLKGKIVFPSNFLAQFYSPWVTEKFEQWPAGIPHKPIGTDPIRFFYPGRTFTNEVIQKGAFPLWNPYIFSGSPHIADFQSAVFYPFNIFYLFLSQITTWSILIFIQPILAMFFTYLYLQLFSIRKLGAFFGAFAFGFSGFIIIWSHESHVVSQSALWLPLVLFGIEGFLIHRKMRYFLVICFALSFSIFAGFFQMNFYIFTLAFFYSLFRSYARKKENILSSLFIVLFGIFFSLGLSAIQLLPSLEAFLESPRPTSGANYLFDTYLLPLSHIINVLVPDIFGSPGSYNFFGRGAYHETVLYIGVVPFIFAVSASFLLIKKSIIRFFVISALMSFFLSLDTALTKWFYNLPLPLISTFLPSRIFMITTFSLATLSAFGISFWLKDQEKKRALNITIVAFLAILVLIAASSLVLSAILQFETPLWLRHYLLGRSDILFKGDIVKIIFRNTALSLLSLVLLLLFLNIRPLRKARILLIALVIFFGQFYYLNKHAVLGYREFLYPQHPVFSFLKEHTFSPYRFLVFGKPILGNISTYEKIYSPEGMDPIFPKRYGQLIFATKNGGKVSVNDLPRLEATLSDLGEEGRLTDNTLRLRLLSLLGIKYIVYFDEGKSRMSIEEKFPKELFLPVWQYKNWYIFEYTKALPRTFLIEHFHLENDPQRIFDRIFDVSFDLSKTIILEEMPESLSTSDIKNNDVMGDLTEATIAFYEPQRVEIHVNTDRERFLVLSDTYYPGWKAFVDDTHSKIYRANYAFRAILVPKGIHVVRFVYEPEVFTIGLIISFVSTTIAFIIACFAFVKRK